MFLNDNKILAHGNTDDVMTSENLKTIYDIPIDIIEKNGRKICFPTLENKDAK